MQNLILKTKKEVFSKQVGLFSTKVGGSGYDFFDLEEYDYTSDAKKIHWNSYAKTSKLYAKVYQEELLKNILIIPIISGSLYFGSRELKSELLFKTLSLIAFSAIKEHSKLKISQYYIKDISELQNFLLKLSKDKIIGKKAYIEKEIFYKFKEKHLTIVISDFLEFTDLSLFAARDDVVAIILKDEFNSECEANLVDNENLKEVSYNLTKKRLKIYKENINKTLNIQKEHFYRHKIDFIEIYERDNIFQKLFLFFKER